LSTSMAPVKAPFSCPNKALSIRLSGIAPQLIGINGHRVDGSCK
jgi:hypothetical protein